MKNIFVKTILLVVLLAAAPTFAYADTVTLSANWFCPQTSDTEIPTNKVLSMTLDTTNGDIDFSQLKTILDTAKKDYPKLDFFDCAIAFQNLINNQIDELCADDKCGPNAKLLESYYKIESALLIYGRNSFADGAITPFEPGAKSDPPLSEEEVKAIAKPIIENCSSKDSNVLTFDESVLEEIASGTSEASADCKRNLAVSLEEQLRQFDIFQFFCDNKNNFNVCTKRRGSIKKTLKFLTQKGLLPDAEKENAFLENTSSCTTIQWGNIENALPDFLKADATKELDNCTKLGVGESKIILGDQGTGSVSNYELSRLEDRELSTDYLKEDGTTITTGLKRPQYQVTLDFNFTSESPDDPAKMREKVATCYADLKEHIRGPNGEFITLVLKQPSSAESTIKTEIKITTNADVREKRNLWKMDTDCQTIVHETMHHLGLVDLYEEQETGVKVKNGVVKHVAKDAGYDAADCRSYGPIYALMSNETYAYISVGLIGRVSGVFRSISEKKVTLTDVLGNEIESKSSLLSEAEFFSIVRPGCKYLNKIFYDCASDARNTSRYHYGFGCNSYSRPECSNQEFLKLKGKAKED